MTSLSDPKERGLYYYRNLVARTYREIRHLGTNGFYRPLEKHYPTLEDKRFDRHWVKPFYEETKELEQPQEIEQVFVNEIGELRLKDVHEAFLGGQWQQSIGGPKWAKIVEETIILGKLLESGEIPAIEEQLVRIDTLWHNTRKVVDDFYQQ